MTDKGKILAFPDTAAIEAEAAAWVARFDAGDVSARDQAAFQEWLNRSALHREAVAQYGNLWSEFDALRSLTDGRDAGPETAIPGAVPAEDGQKSLACGLRGGCRDCHGRWAVNRFPPSQAAGPREGHAARHARHAVL